MPPPDQEPPEQEPPEQPSGDSSPVAVGTEPPAGASATTTPRRGRHWLVKGGVIVVIALVLAVLLRLFVFQVFYIPSTSMLPTLHPGDRIVVDKLSYDLHAIDRGDIIVFKRPADEHCGGPPVPDLVKRVIGLPGDTISARGGKVYIDGKELPEPWLPKVSSTYTYNFGPVKVPKGDYFMMGDNRISSCDSRYWGPVPRSLVVGKVIVLIWPFSHFRLF